MTALLREKIKPTIPLKSHLPLTSKAEPSPASVTTATSSAAGKCPIKYPTQDRSRFARKHFFADEVGGKTKPKLWCSLFQVSHTLHRLCSGVRGTRRAPSMGKRIRKAHGKASRIWHQPAHLEAGTRALLPAPKITLYIFNSL